jgi:hypothetical protein
MDFKPFSCRHGEKMKHEEAEARMRLMADWFMDIEKGKEVLWQIEIYINLKWLFIINSTSIFMV